MTSHAGTTSDVSTSGVSQKKPWYKVLYVQVLIAILVGAIFGWLEPTYATNDWVKPLGDGFIKLIKMIVAPIVFCTLSLAWRISRMPKKVGRIGVKALLYFEVVSTFALVIGLIVGNVVQPRRGFHGRCGDDPRTARSRATKQAKRRVGRVRAERHSRHGLQRLRPGRYLAGPAVLGSVGFAMMFHWANAAHTCIAHRLRGTSFFRHHRDGREAAPIGAFGAMAYTIGKLGPGRRLPGQPDGHVLVTAALFVFVILGIIARVVGFSISGSCLHPGGTVARARYLIFGNRVAGPDSKDRPPRLYKVDGRARGPDRV